MSRKFFRGLGIALTIIVGALVIGGLARSQAARDAEAAVKKILGQVLTPRQLRVLDDFRRAELKAARPEVQKARAEVQSLDPNLLPTNAQEDRIIGLVESNLDRILRLARAFLEDEREIRQALTRESPDPAELKSLGLLLSDDIGDATVLAAGEIKKGRAALTPEQNAVVAKYLTLGRREAQNLPAELSVGIKKGLQLWKDLDLSPAQIQGLAGQTKNFVRLADQEHKLQEIKLEAKLRSILTPGQMRTLKKFEASHQPQLEAQRQKELDRGLALVKKLNLSTGQMDRLAALVEANQEDIIAAADGIVRAAVGLFDRVVAENPDPTEVRAAAAELGAPIGEALTLAAGMIQSARQIIGPAPFQAILLFVGAQEQNAEKIISESPGWFNEILDLRDELNLTQAQKTALAKLAKQEALKEMDDFLRRP